MILIHVCMYLGVPTYFLPSVYEKEIKKILLSDIKSAYSIKNKYILNYMCHIMYRCGNTKRTRKRLINIDSIANAYDDDMYILVYTHLMSYKPLNIYKESYSDMYVIYLLEILKTVVKKRPHKYHFEIFIYDVYTYGVADAVIRRGCYDWDNITQHKDKKPCHLWMLYELQKDVCIPLYWPGCRSNIIQFPPTTSYTRTNIDDDPFSLLLYI
jgi:hypothetical protein